MLEEPKKARTGLSDCVVSKRNEERRWARQHLPAQSHLMRSPVRRLPRPRQNKSDLLLVARSKASVDSKGGLKSVSALANNNQMTARERVAHLLKAWPKIYPHAHRALDFRNPLQLLVATILS